MDCNSLLQSIPFNLLLAESGAIGAAAGKNKMQTRTADEAGMTGGRSNVGGVGWRSRMLALRHQLSLEPFQVSVTQYHCRNP